MFNLGFGEIALILVVALVFVGPKMLPEIATTLGKVIREFRKATSDIRDELELDDVIRKPLQDLRDAATLPPEELRRRDELRASQRSAEAEEEKLRKEREANAEKALAESPPDPYASGATAEAPAPGPQAAGNPDQTVFDPTLATAVLAEMKKSPALPSPYAAERTLVDDVLSKAAKSDEKARAAAAKPPAQTLAMEKPVTPAPAAQATPTEIISTGGTMISNPPPPGLAPEPTPMVELTSFETVDPTPPPQPVPPRLPPPFPGKKS